MSNEDWVNPHDPDAKIGPTKAGGTDLLYQPENTVDLETGAILQAEVRLGHEPDHKDLAQHVLAAQENINTVPALPADSLTIVSATADQGYYAVPEMGPLQAEGIRTVISDPVKHRKLANLSPAEAKVVRTAKRSAQSKSGTGWLQQRGRHLERTLAHILDAGGDRRTTLRGWANLNQRFKLAAAIYNLSPLMRKLFGVGTPKQWAVGARGLFCRWWTFFVTGWSRRVAGRDPRMARGDCQWQQYRALLPDRIKDRVRVLRDASPLNFETGVFQQAARPAEAIFGHHSVVEKGIGLYYDPAYGKTYTNSVDFIDQSIEGIIDTRGLIFGPGGVGVDGGMNVIKPSAIDSFSLP